MIFLWFWNDFGMILGWFWDPPLECDSSARGAPPRRVFNACARWAPPPRKKAVGRGAAPGGDYYEMQSTVSKQFHKIANSPPRAQRDLGMNRNWFMT